MNPSTILSIVTLATASICFFLILIAGFKTDLLKESNVPGNPYSFSRFQLWLWTLIISPAFVLNWGYHAFEKPERVIITSGCGGGVTFDDPSVGIEPLQSNLHVSPGLLRQGFRQLQSPKSLYARSGGVHAAGLLDVETEKLIVVVEDVGRHNAIDKLTGICLQQEIATRDRILIATGRISSEMLRKAALMGCPIMASRNSPTSLSVEMARAWRVTLIGYVRSGKLRVYSHPERLGFDTSLT